MIGIIHRNRPLGDRILVLPYNGGVTGAFGWRGPSMKGSAGFLDRLTQDERIALEPLLRPKTVHRGEILFEQGAEPEWFLLVLRGTMKVCRSSGLGRDVILELLFPGDLCGALCALDHRPYPVSCVALQDGEIFRIAREEILALCSRHPGVLAKAVPDCQEKMRLQRQILVGMAVERAEQRAARALLLLAERLGRRTPEGLLTPMVLDRQEFSEMIGTTVETAIRVLSRMRKDGILYEEKHHCLILDEARLVQIAGLEDETFAPGACREDSPEGTCLGCLAC